MSTVEASGGASTEPHPLHVYFGLAGRARQAGTQEELQFLICNDTRALLPYRQAMLFLPGVRGQWRLVVHSGLSLLGEPTPYQIWLEALMAWHHTQANSSGSVIQLSALPESLRAGWEEWLPEGVLVLPLSGADGVVQAWWMLAREEAWTWPPVAPDPAIWLLELQAVYGHALWAWTHASTRKKFFSWYTSLPRLVWGALIALVVLALLPVRLSVLAPAEVTPVDPYAISAPMDGVVKHVPILPGHQVKKGEVIVELDDTVLVNRRKVLEESLRTTDADLLQALQQSFDDQSSSRASLNVLRGKVEEKKAELASIVRQMERLQIRSPADGVFIYSDQLDWVGKPVQTGERIGLLADPDRRNMTVWIPTSDAINLEKGAEVRLYLHISPLKSLFAHLTETSFSAQPASDGIVSYRVKADFEQKSENMDEARIGLKGTAKIYGERVPLIYMLLRRPLASLRAWSGW